MAKRISRAQARAAGFKNATEAIVLLGSDARAVARQLEKNELMFSSNWGFGGSAATHERLISLDDLKAAYQAGFKAGQLQTMTKTEFRKELRKHYAATTAAIPSVANLTAEQKGAAISKLWKEGRKIGNLENYITFLNNYYDEELEEILEDEMKYSTDFMF